MSENKKKVLTRRKIREIKRMRKEGKTYGEIATELNLSLMLVVFALRGKELE